ncbi:MAG: c-type cytochrome biogenesis protein CcmI [Thauera sp.]
MTFFIIFAGLLVAGALLLVLPPLLGVGAHRRREEARQSTMALKVLREQLAELDAELATGQIDAASHARSREELERRALEEGEAAAEAAEAADTRPSRVWAAAVALSIPLAAVGAYLTIGEPDALNPENLATQQGFTQDQVQDMVGSLEARLKEEPDNAEGWAMLARTYLILQDYPKAATAYAQLDRVVPDNPNVLSDWADVVAAMEGFGGKAEELVQRALQVSPGHPKALALAGTAAYQRNDFAGAVGYWERILAQIPAGDPSAEGVRASINDARAKAGMQPLGENEGLAAAVPAQSELKVSGRLELDGALAERVAADDVVFVFVRSEAGGPPLAALRFTGGELPLAFSFDGEQLIMGNTEVPERVVIAARVAKGGDATARSGDLEGASAPVSPDAEGVTVVIDRVRE